MLQICCYKFDVIWCYVNYYFHYTGVFRSIGPKPPATVLAKKRLRPFWMLHEFKEAFICCTSKPKRSALIDIMTAKIPEAEPYYMDDNNCDGRESRISGTSTIGSAESTTALRKCIEIG